MAEDGIHHWGYVMWDAVRLERTGAREVLARQWDAQWGEDDSRDHVYSEFPRSQIEVQNQRGFRANGCQGGMSVGRRDLTSGRPEFR